MATLKAEKLALKSTTAKPSSSRRYSTQQYTPTTHTTFSNRNQKNLHSWFSENASSKPKPFPKLLPLSRESSQSSSSTGNNNNNSTNKEALLEDSTALGKLREYRLKLELRANTLRTAAGEEGDPGEGSGGEGGGRGRRVSTEEPLPKYGGLATAAHQFPTWLVAVKDLVLDRAQLDDRAKFRRIFYALEDAADQRLISADADIESPDLCRVVKLLFNRHMGEGEEDGQGQEEEVGGGIRFCSRISSSSWRIGKQQNFFCFELCRYHHHHHTARIH
ncbi:hypothetical protein TYRP_015281 [Tyrophagus putrescentiae]|nr:hypothetical protein TYRP_015281 [Tyrophagus putrescentiae]